jgi:putative endonuclease
MWYVYVLRSLKDDNLYIGSTDNIKRRVLEHNSKQVTSTKNRVPFKPEAYFAVNNKSRAIELEKYLKTGSGKAFLNKRIL